MSKFQFLPEDTTFYQRVHHSKLSNNVGKDVQLVGLLTSESKLQITQDQTIDLLHYNAGDVGNFPYSEKKYIEVRGVVQNGGNALEFKEGNPVPILDGSQGVNLDDYYKSLVYEEKVAGL